MKTIPVLVFLLLTSFLLNTAHAAQNCYYLTKTTTSIGTDYLPLLPVVYTNPQNNLNTNQTVLVDSGSTVSLAPSTLANILSINLNNSASIQVSGISGSIQANVVNLTLTIGSQKYSNILVAIATVSTAPYLLGRTNFLSIATVTIDSNTKAVCIGPFSASAYLLTLSIPIVLFWLGVGGFILAIIWYGRRKS